MFILKKKLWKEGKKMPKWTEEQKQAIDQEGSNIIVSAGAGSGKTAVLTARVLRKLKEGIDIDHLLILTFTKLAAKEMKDRIRSSIQKEESLQEQLSKLDNASITTFDSYALSIVKKYHYLIPVSKEIKIGDATILHMKKKELLDDIFLEYYEKEDPDFLEMISLFCTKDDHNIRTNILEMSSKLDLKYDKVHYLETYLDWYFTEEAIENRVREYVSYLQEIKEEIKSDLERLCPYVEGDYYAALEEILFPLFDSKTYDDIKSHLEVKLPNLKRGSEEEPKNIKKSMTSRIAKLKDACFYESEEEIKKTLLSTKKTVSVLIRLLLELDHQYESYKKEKGLYEFIDISKLAIQIVEENPQVQSELREYLNEIMVDEYQDTNDLQEKFLSLIERDNIYMVGDIKQSIYRFRNANPDIFKEKYDRYSMHHGGEKIDLNRNFRSRSEVLSDINVIFDFIMDDVIGGARYKESHRMVFGNQVYEEEENNQEDNHLELLRYPYPKGFSYRKEEVEAFLIAKDIKAKVEKGYRVLEKETGKSRKARYSDFVILMDRSTHFDLYKKIFTYLKLPLSITKDEDLSGDDDFSILFHLIRLIIKTKKQEIDTAFRYSFLAVFRSYLFAKTDAELFSILQKNAYFSLPEMDLVKSLASHLDQETITSLLTQILDQFPFYERRITVGNIKEMMARFAYLSHVFEDLEDLGYTVYDIDTYFSDILENKEVLKYPNEVEEANSISLMTIHKSKGLEFPILYLPGLDVGFNEKELNEKFLFDETYGFVVPAYREGILETINKTLLKEKYRTLEISERIRLFYVALTRAREKMIFVLPEEEGLERKEEMVEIGIRRNYHSFFDVMKSVQEDFLVYAKNQKLEEIPLTRAYQTLRKENLEIEESLEDWKEDMIQVDCIEEETEKLSKKVDHLLTKEENEARELGLAFHSYLESIDLKHPDLEGIPTFYASKIKKFCALPIIAKQDYQYYQEYEFIWEKEEVVIHGIIDLLLAYEDHYTIIDYKLANVKDEAYRKQLMGYASYIKEKTGKEVFLYLYSILYETLESIDI